MILLAALSACNIEKQDPPNTQVAPGSATGDPAIVHHPEPPPRPASKADSLELEGTYERFTVRLVQPPTDLRFSTYAPADMVHEQLSSGEGEAHYFYTAFAGKKNPGAFLLVFFYPQGTTQQQARSMVNAFAESRQPLQRSAEAGPQYSGSIMERDFEFERGGVVYHGDISLGSHQGRLFHVAHQYPEDYSEGFWPRVDYILKQWVWLDSGQGLELTGRPPRE